MSVSSIDEKAASRLAMMEAWARRQVGSATAARARVARAVGLPAGMLERVRRQRLKGVRSYVADAIRDAFVKQIELEIRGLEHELFMALQGGADPSGPQAQAARDAIDKAREVIAEGMKREG